MPVCCVPGCDSRRERNPELSFYRLPADEKLRQEWLRRIRREKNFTPTCNTRICSAHFISGKEFGPQLFPWNCKKLFQVQSRENKVKCQRRKCLDQSADASPSELGYFSLNSLADAASNELLQCDIHTANQLDSLADVALADASCSKGNHVELELENIQLQKEVCHLHNQLEQNQ